MKIGFPSREFDDAVAAICHGLASEEQMRALNEVLRQNAAARDEYILRVEVHARLASEPDLFASLTSDPDGGDSAVGTPLPQNLLEFQQNGRSRIKKTTWVIAVAACFAGAAGLLSFLLFGPTAPKTTSKAVAMLNRTAGAQWEKEGEIPRLGAPLEPGSIKLESGLAQIVFYSGARVLMEGPAELQLISQNNAFCHKGRIKADVPVQARGFRVDTPQTTITDLGTSFAFEVKDHQTELHVFKGSVRLQAGTKATEQNVQEGNSAIVDDSKRIHSIKSDPTAFASLFSLQEKSLAAEALRYDQWRESSAQLNGDSSLVAHFDFESVAPSGWQIPNLANKRANIQDATIVGCQRGEGRWPDKRALEFRSVSDRVRLNVPGEFQALTLTAWVSVKGLDRKINSLFMSDGFEPGTVHWVIRNDGALGLTVIGSGPGNHQIVASPAALTLEKLGTWVHLAVVLDGSSKRVAHYVNGQEVGEKTLKINPPFRIDAAELGNWNAKGFAENDPFMIRNFSGAIDEFCIFSRALSGEEIQALHLAGKPQCDPIAQNLN